MGHYEILGPLGAGGMGEVWRALDSRLGREVALKLIRETVGADPEARRRFEQEARATARLRHPNVVTLFDVGEHEGAPFLVCELLEGDTLRVRLGGGRLPAGQALGWAAQIARGLASAHEKGILHRDLKPENVFVTREGSLKILDFGLARLRPPEEGASFSSEAATASQHTAVGTVLGTLAYMSPEQARGALLDERTDLFAVGAILYEMLAGRRAFQRGSMPETVSAILTVDPTESGLPEALPPRAVRLLRRCLAKDPAERFRCASDLAAALEDPETLALAPAVEGRAGGEWTKHILAASVMAAALGIGAALGSLWHGHPPDLPALQPLTFGRGPIKGARFTPDGQTVVFSAAWGGEPFRLHMQRLSDPEELPFGPARTQLLGISPSAELLVLLNRRLDTSPFAPTGTLGRLPLTGGAPREVLDSAEAADWVAGTGQIVLVRNAGATRRLELPAGHLLYETGGSISDLRVRPDGRAVAFLEHPSREGDFGQVVVIDIGGAVIRRAGDPGQEIATGLAWRTDGSELLWSDNNGEVRALSSSGGERIVLRIPPWAVLHDLSASGLALVAQDSHHVAAVVGEPRSLAEHDLSWLSWSLVGRIAPDGRQLLFTEFGLPRDPNGTAALRSLDGSSAIRLGAGFAHSLSPDGRLVLVSVRRPRSSLMLIPTGAGASQELPAGPIEEHSWADFLPDGRTIVFVGREPQRPRQLYLQDVDHGPPHRLGTEPIGLGLVLASPDGAWAAASGLDRRLRLFSLPAGGARPVPQALLGELPVGWSADSRALFVYRHGDVPVRLRRLDIAGGQPTVVGDILPSDPAGVDWIGPLTVTPDGSHFAYSYMRTLSQLYLVRGLDR